MSGTPYGDHWRSLRRISAQELLSTARLNAFLHIRQDETRRLLSRLYEISRQGFSKVVLRPKLSELTFNVMMRMIAGKRYFSQENEGEQGMKFLELINKVFVLSQASNPQDFLPFLQWIDYGDYKKNMIRLSKKLDDFFEALLDEHRVERRNSMIGHLLSLQESQSELYSDQTIKGLILIIRWKISMEEFRSQKIFPFLSLCFLFHFSSIFLSTADYALPDHYFINCGSASSLRVYDGRATFTGDVNSRNLALSRGSNSPVKDSNSSNVELYRSARIFRKPSWYEFDITQNGTFVVRFHFFPFSSLGNFIDAHFSVTASGFSLLSNFTVGKRNISNLPLIEEFLITIRPGKFKINFVPNKENLFAFVNAIEVFLAPPELIKDNPTLVAREGSGENYTALLSVPLRVIHRVNVGGQNIMPNNDTLLRSWIPDDIYLLNKEVARNKTYGAKPKYQSPGANEYDAPDFVYNTAKELNTDNSSRLNISWHFDVKNGVRHLVRVHFCDIVSSTTNEFLQFNLYIYSQFSEMIRPYYIVPQLAAPFYLDFEVDSDDSGFINLTVGSTNTNDSQTAFLNGVEIMELISDLAEGSESTGKHLIIIIGSVAGSAILLIVTLIVVLYLKRRKLKPIEAFDRPLVPLFAGSTHSKITDKTVSGSPLVDLNLCLKVLFSEILYATNNFDTNLMIGEGGFGKVYKGMLRNGTKVAVKRSEPGHGQGLPEFQTEIMVLSKIRHNHLVSLIGYCDERDEMILVYEFMEKGTLREHLYKVEYEKSTSRPELSWDKRVQICIGAAKGIHYLHTGSSGAIIHRDIKSTNILLDERYVAKVADFGLSRSGPLDQTHVSTDVKGSFGYLDPEYFRCLQLTQKSDVYSFGVVLLEVLCARPAIDHSLPREQISLADWGVSWLKKGQLEKIVDPFLEGKINPYSLRKFGQTIDKCLQEYGADRPNMIDVLWDLEYSLRLQNTATPREPYEDSTTDISLGLPMTVIQRLPSQNIPVGEDELHESYSFSDSSQVNAPEVFSQLKIDEAR